MSPLPPGWRERWITWRNRLLADARFQRWAADFPLTRPIARRRTRGLFDLVAAFVYSQALAACVRLGLLQMLARGRTTVASVAETLSLPPDSAERLLRAAVALGLADGLTDSGGAQTRGSQTQYTLGPQGAALLGNAGLMDMIEHHQHLYADLADCCALLRQGEGPGVLAAYWPYATSATPREANAESVAAYSALMAATMPSVAADVLQAYPLSRHRRLLDVGGGEGAFLAAAGHSAPGLELMLMDLPAVTLRARERLRREGLLDRTKIFAGDFLADGLPKGADLISLVRILHDQDDAGAAALLSAARAALAPGGTLLIAEPMSGRPAPDRVADVYFAFYLLAMGRGGARTPAEIFALLRVAGFRHLRLLRTRTPMLLRLIQARP